MSTFISVDDNLVAERIAAASRRIVLVTPGVSLKVAEALGRRLDKTDQPSIMLILDPNEEPHRIGYGDRLGLEALQKYACANHIELRSQPGLRIGLLLTDDKVLIWSPTPKAVEDQRRTGEPNGVDLGVGAAVGMTEGPGSLSDVIRNSVGAPDSKIPLSEAEIGRTPFTPEQVAKTTKALAENPPADFDLSRKARVFSTKFQFVEFERHGAAWTTREIKLSSLLLNPDVPDELKDLFETRVRPFSAHANLAIKVPTLVLGQIAYSREGEPILSPMSQADMEKEWNKIIERYLRWLKGFGWLLHKPDKPALDAAVAAYETVLQKWVAGFREVATKDEAQLIDQLVGVIKARATQPAAKGKLNDMNIKEVVEKGIARLRIIEPSVKLVFKEISWESTRDAEFTTALRKAFPEKDLSKWFEEFTAARERSSI